MYAMFQFLSKLCHANGLIQGECMVSAALLCQPQEADQNMLLISTCSQTTSRLTYVLIEGIIEKITHAKISMENAEHSRKLINISLAIALIELLCKNIATEDPDLDRIKLEQACESLILMLHQANQQNNVLLLDEVSELLLQFSS